MPVRNQGLYRLIRSLDQGLEYVANAFPTSTLDRDLQTVVIDAYEGDTDAAMKIQERLLPGRSMRIHRTKSGHTGIAIGANGYYYYSKTPSRAHLLAVLCEYREDEELNAIADERQGEPEVEVNPDDL